MSIHLVVTTHDAGMAMHVGGPVESWSKVFEIDNPALETELKRNSYQSKTITIVEEGEK